MGDATVPAAFEMVERPRGGGNVSSALIKALMETKGTNKAVRLQLADHSAFTNWQANVRATLRTEHSLRLRTKFNKSQKVVTAWVEDFDKREAGTITDADLGVSEDNS